MGSLSRKYSSFCGTQLIELRNREYAEILPPGPERDLALQMLVDDSFLSVVAWIIITHPGFYVF